MKSLKWSDRTKEWISKRVFDSSDDVQYGSSCIFVPLTKKIGAKIYFDGSNRNFSHSNQIHAHSNGMGSRVGDKFEMNFLCISEQNDERYVREAYKRKVYGYLTEIAEHVETISRSDKMDICKKLKSIGLKSHDLDARNLGRINGKLIVIDFDMLTFRLPE